MSPFHRTALQQLLHTEAAAEHGLLPQVLAKGHSTFGTPGITQLATGLLAVSIAWLPSIQRARLCPSESLALPADTSLQLVVCMVMGIVLCCNYRHLRGRSGQADKAASPS